MAAQVTLARALPTAQSAAVVVAYHPARAICALVDTLRQVVATVLVVDNTPEGTPWLAQALPVGARLLSPGRNLGISAAYNLAVQALADSATEADSLFLFDQDSAPSVACLTTLMAALGELRAQGHKVAQVGPAYYESQRAFFPPLIEVDAGRLRRVPVAQAGRLHRVAYMISSGTLVDLGAVRALGGFDEQLFIDYVDIEWGLRCQARGYESWIACQAQMTHAIGEAPLRLARWKMPSHSATRRHYQARNAVLLMRRREIPLIWKLHELARFPARLVFMALARDGLPGQLRGWLRGLRDGLCGRTGPLP